MKIAILSDIHSNFEALASVLAELGDHDAMFVLGDMVGYGAEPNRVLQTIRALKPSIMLGGNHEYAVCTGDMSMFPGIHGVKAVVWTREQLTHENLRYISSLHSSSSLELEGVRISAFHGSPRDPLNEYVYPITPRSTMRVFADLAKADVTFLGHSHIPFTVTLDSDLIVNPGSVGQPRDGDPRASYGVLEISDGEFSYSARRVSYDVDSAARKILENHLPGILADRLQFGF